MNHRQYDTMDGKGLFYVFFFFFTFISFPRVFGGGGNLGHTFQLLDMSGQMRFQSQKRSMI